VSEIKPLLNVPQAKFLALPNKFKAFVAGFGTGKTWVGCAGVCSHTFQHPRVAAGYFASTYPQIRDIFYPTIEEVAHTWGLRAKVRTGDKEVDLYRGKTYMNTVICRSMERPETIVGFKIGHGVVDEFDVMQLVKAKTAWRKIIARMRYKVDGLRNGLDVTTTPEGFKATYELFVKEAGKKEELKKLYGLIHASTYDNERNLPDDYIPSLLASYPPELISAYLRGMFTNLTSGSVYRNFSRLLNCTNEKRRPNEPLHIGMDFNVNNMSAVVCVIRDGRPIVVEEITKGVDTPAVIKTIKERYGALHPSITIYPDPAGKNASSKSASTSDHLLLRKAGFNVVAHAAHPAVKDRVAAVNMQILNTDDQRRLLVNVDACPTVTENLEQQVYDTNGEPDKGSGKDHANDALGYFIEKTWPIGFDRRAALRVSAY